MNWRDLLHIDLGRLLRGKVETGPPPAWDRVDLCGRGGTVLDILSTPFTLFGTLLKHLLVRRQRHLITVTDQIARIVACNAPLVPALEAVIEDVPSQRVWRTLLDLRTALTQGMSLAEAMRRKPRFFPGYYVDLVDAGERSGSLHAALRDLSDSLGVSLRLRDAARRVFAYLGLLFVFGSVMMTFLAVKVYPVYVEILYDFGAPLPLHLKMQVALLDFISSRMYGWGAALSALIAVVWIVILWRVWRNRRLASLRTRIALAVPFLRRLVAEANLAHAARVLERLLAAGYPVDEALEGAATADISPAFRSALLRMRDRVRQGETLQAAAERETWVLPPSFRGMVALGESSGRLPESLGSIAYLYGRRTIRAFHYLLGAMLPVGVIAMGLFVLNIHFALFSAMTSIFDALIQSM